MCSSEDTPDDGLTVHLDLDLTAAVAPLALIRRRLSVELADLGVDRLRDVQVICVELVSNAYEHAAGPRRVRVRRFRGRAALHVEVHDGSPEGRLVVGRSRLGEHRGRGLVLVRALAASQWGVRVTPGGKVVWAEVPLPAEPGAGE
ncbi:ATP-binding protein [Actinokineospora pegani]|uniref:ATP-binding protein n=1 Tax=Actinokineospora pegani TaxID=2654637 RepID=UPI0012EA565E|nr:ATP-binding protein [Actinokineospora pegani]